MGSAAVATEKRTVWLWWGGDCEACLACCGLHYSEPENKPPLHPNCDCTLGRVELPAALEARLTGQFARSLRLVREMNLVSGDRNLTEREGELLALCRENLDDALSQAAAAGRVEQYHLDWNEWVLTDCERQSSRIKYRLSREGAEAASGDKLDKSTYSNKALDKVEEMDSLLQNAAEEFNANIRAVKAAFADEYDRRDISDVLQDNIQHGRLLGWMRKIPPLNDYGLSNIDYYTAARLQIKYDIDIPARMDLDEYLCTNEGCARFTAAAIREAQDFLHSCCSSLSAAQKSVMDALNKDEMDALLVTVYKRGPESVRNMLDRQIENMLKPRNRQRYLYIGEGYKALCLWLTRRN